MLPTLLDGGGFARGPSGAELKIVASQLRTSPRLPGGKHGAHEEPVLLDRPLTRTEYERLADFLDSCGDEAMGLVEAHGFLTAVLSAPTVIMPSTWQPLVLGDRAQFEDLAHAQESIGLLLRLFNEIASELQAETLTPLSYPDPQAIEIWCTGYLRGARLDDEWRADNYAVAYLLPIAVLCGAFDLTGSEDAEGNEITDPTRHIQRYREDLPKIVRTLHAHFLEWRAPAPAPTSRPKIGRNEPCPCGSSKKFKKCCLSTAASSDP